MAMKLSDEFVRNLDKELKAYNEYMLKYFSSFAYKRLLVRQRRLARMEEENGSK